MATQHPVGAQEMPLLRTKLYIPPPRPDLVPRPRLIERLNAGLHRKLTLVSAPAGFGKTTLISEWVADQGRRKVKVHTAWLSLDEIDNDLTRFLAYLIAALRAGLQAAGQTLAASGPPTPQPLPTESILTALINEIDTLPDRIVLVLDDYHVIDAPPIDHALTFLLEHLPPQMHLVIATREDPQLPLARLRVRGQLTELREADLRFVPSEAADLYQVMGLYLSAEEIAALETRTEGWIAGLQMAGLALQGAPAKQAPRQGRADTAGFIQAFTGSHRFVMDYMVEEILQQQPEHVRSFLLQTSILDRLCGPLCDAVRFGVAKSHGSSERTALKDGKRMLVDLERGNLFVVPLDDKRQWYRYHRLFADVLCAHAIEEQPDQVLALHRRASEWYEQNGLPADAIHHALAAEDFLRAASLVELAWPAMESSYQFATWLGWVRALPDELVRARPVLSVDYGKALLYGGELEAGEARLRDAERWLDAMADARERPEALPAEVVVVAEERFQSLPVSIAMARAYHAQALGDGSETIKYARRALDLLPEGDFRRISTATYLGLAYWASGDLKAAYQVLADSVAGKQMAGNIADAMGLTICLVDIKDTQGRLHEAIGLCEQSLQLASAQGMPVVRGTADLHLELGMLYHERGDWAAAEQHLQRSEELGTQAAFPFWGYRWCLALARMKESQGDLDGALDLLDKAERLYFRNLFPEIRPISALKTRVWIGQGRLDRAVDWVHEQGLSVHDDLCYLRECEHVTLARVLIARHKSEHPDRSIPETMELLERLLKAAEKGGRLGSVIEILVLQALAHEAQDNIPLALPPLERALALAEPEGYVRIFVDEGPPMARLLYEALSRGIKGRSSAAGYAGKLLAAFPAVDAPPVAQSKIPESEISQSKIVEPLSERELEVLELIAEGLTNGEIAARLYLSLNTIKGHARNIYGKLGVHSRTQAVARARAYGILPST